MTGSTRKRGPTWTAYWFVPQEDGRRRQMTKGGFRTKREAQEYLTGVLNSIRTGTFVTPNRQTLGEFFDLWIAGAPARLRPGTVDKYARDFDRYVRPALGGVRLQALTPFSSMGSTPRCSRTAAPAGRASRRRAWSTSMPSSTRFSATPCARAL